MTGVDATTVISVIALLVSFVSVVLAWRTSGHQHQLQLRDTDLQERLVALETAREKDRLRASRSAQVTASIVREHVRASRTDYWLRIANEGRAAAGNIRVLLDEKPALEHELTLSGEDEITTLGPGADARYHLAVTMGSPRVVLVRVSWDDESGDPGLWISQLKI